MTDSEIINLTIAELAPKIESREISQTAVNVVGLTGDEIGLVRDQKTDHVCLGP